MARFAVARARSRRIAGAVGVPLLAVKALLAVDALLAAGCGDAVTLAIASDRPVPQAIDAICVGVADVADGGGAFGQRYQLVDELGSLPQTLRVEPGSADTAWAWVRGDRAGVPVARAGQVLDFSGDLTLALDRCERGPAAPPQVFGDPVGPASARLVVSHGANGAMVAAFGADTAVLLDAAGAELGEAGPLPVPAGPLVAAIPADLDNDCDDDLVLVGSGAPELWLRDAATAAPAGTLGDAPVAALAAGDVDRDGDIDVITGGGDVLALWKNDGAGGFAATAIASEGRARSVTALALGDLDGDGNPELVVGQAGDPLVGFLGDPGGGFRVNDAIVPPVPLDVARLQLVDADGDFDPDLVVTIPEAPLRLYVARDGRLEDQTFVRLADSVPAAHAVAIGGWDAGCEPDAVIATDAGTEARRGQPEGVLATEATAPAATDVVMTDLDEDGDLDAVLATPQGVLWLAR